LPTGGPSSFEPSEPELLSEYSNRDRPWDNHRAEADAVARIYASDREFEKVAGRVSGCSEFLGFGWKPDRDDPAVLSLVDFIIPNETELQIMTGVSGNYEDQVGGLLRMGVKHVIVTLGDKGCLLADEKGTAYFSARKVHAVDTTAAGDAFIGGFTQGLAEGMTIDESIRFATQVAAFSTTRKGAQPSLGTKSEVETFFEAGLA
jgi:ribokinase